MARIYKSQSYGTVYQGAAQSAQFDPVQAASQEQAAREKGEQKVRDAAIKGEEASRNLYLQNFEEEQQMRIDVSAQEVEQLRVWNALKAEQQIEAVMLDDTQLVERNELKFKQALSNSELKLDQMREGFTEENSQLLQKQELQASQLSNSQALERFQSEFKADMDTKAAQFRADTAAAQSELRAQGAMIDGLFKFAGIGLQGAKLWQDVQAQKEVDAQAKSAVDWVLGGSSDSVKVATDRSNALQVETSNQVQDQATETAIVNAAPGDPAMQEGLRQDSADQRAFARVRQANVYEAAAEFGPRVATLLADPNTMITFPDGTTRPANTAKVDEVAYAVRAVSSFVARELGVANMDAVDVAKGLVPTIRSTIANQTARMLPDAIGTAQDSRIEAAEVAVVKGLEAGSMSVGEAFQTMANDIYASGKFGGNRTKANDEAIKRLLPLLSIDQLEQLKGVQKVPGQPGTELGRGAYGQTIDQTIRQRRSGELTDIRQQRQETSLELEQLGQQRTLDLINAQTPEEVRQINQNYEAELLRIGRGGNPEALELWQKEQTIGDNYNPLVLGEYRDRIAAGEAISQDEIDADVSRGTITPQEGAQIIKEAGITSESAAQTIKPYAKEWKDYITAQTKAKLAQGLGIEESAKALAPVIGDINNRVQNHMADFIRKNPNASDAEIRQEAVRTIDEITKSSLEGAKFNDQTGAIEGYDYSRGSQAAAASASTKWYTDPKTGNRGRVLTNLTTTDLKGINNDGDNTNDLNIVSDRLLTREEFKNSVEAIRKGNLDAVSPRVKAIADIAGTSVRDLVLYQGRGQGIANMEDALKPDIEVSPDLGATGPGPTNMKTGFNALQQMGFPARGAAVLAGNIQQESAWNGMRDWGQVMGDGTSRNGGLISWASWANDPARLGKIENYLGKNIKNATHAEQLQAMLWEMKNDYPDAYRIFKNPNATPAQLRRASYRYWGYGHEGARFNYANQLRPGVA